MPSIRGWRSPNNPLLGFCHSNVFHPSETPVLQLGSPWLRHVPSPRSTTGESFWLPGAATGQGTLLSGEPYRRRYVIAGCHLPRLRSSAAKRPGARSREPTPTVKTDLTESAKWSAPLFLLPSLPQTLTRARSLALLSCPGECCSSCGGGITQARRRKRTIIFNICQTHDSNSPSPTHQHIHVHTRRQAHAHKRTS